MPNATTEKPDFLRDVEVTQYLKECVTIEPMALEEEFIRVPSDLAYWGAKWADAQRTAALAKLTEKEVAAALDAEHREALAAQGAKVTEKMVESAVVTDARMREATIARIDADAMEARFKAFADAVRTKKDMVSAIGLQVRAEMQADPSIRQQMTGRHFAKNG